MADHVTESVLRSARLLSDEEIRKRYRFTVEQTVKAARETLGPGVKITTRDLLATDLAETNNIWSGQTGSTASAFENSIIANQAIANEAFVGLYGVLNLSTVNSVSHNRITVGGKKVAQWSLFQIIGGDESGDVRVRTGIAGAPIIISQNITVLIENYVRVATEGYELVYLGVVAEKAGKTIDI